MSFTLGEKRAVFLRVGPPCLASDTAVEVWWDNVVLAKVKAGTYSEEQIRQWVNDLLSKPVPQPEGA